VSQMITDIVTIPSSSSLSSLSTRYINYLPE